MQLNRKILLLTALGAATTLCAQKPGDGVPDKVTVHGSVQADVLFPEDDYKIGTEHYSDDILGNFYGNVGVFSKYVDGGARIEYLEHPLPGFEKAFKGWGLANVYATGKYNGMELTIGDF